MTTLHRAIRRAAQTWTQHRNQYSVRPLSTSALDLTTEVTQKRLDGKVAIITGAGAGIGAATAKLFAAHGAHVILTDVADEQGQKLADEIAKDLNSNTVLYRHCDASKEADVASVVDFAVEKFGKLDIMHNNGGPQPPSTESIENMDMEDYDRCTAIFVRGVLLGIKHAGRVMVPRKQGTILNTASALTMCVDLSAPLIYNMNKQALSGVTKVAAAHYGRHGVRVNSVSPGGVPTQKTVELAKQLGIDIDMNTLKEMFAAQSPLRGKCCTPEDVAYGALYLCSDESSYVSGHNLLIDAGYSHIVDFGVDFKKNCESLGS